MRGVKEGTLSKWQRQYTKSAKKRKGDNASDFPQSGQRVGLGLQGTCCAFRGVICAPNLSACWQRVGVGSL
jgi:hypothetical protein